MPREPKLDGLVAASPEMFISLIGMLHRSGLVTDDEVEEFAYSLKGRNGLDLIASELIDECL